MGDASAHPIQQFVTGRFIGTGQSGFKGQSIRGSMALEDQAVVGPLTKLQFDLAVKKLVEGSRRELW